MSRVVDGVFVIEAELPDKCTSCGETQELRPYGVNGARICHSCAMATPEAKAETERQIDARLVGAFRHKYEMKRSS